MPLKPEDIKETVEIKTDEADKYVKLGWEIIDTYKTDQGEFKILAWGKSDPPAKP